MAYNKINWENGTIRQEGYVTIDGTQYQTVQPEYEGNTPINATNLNHMDEGIKEAHNLMSDSGWIEVTVSNGASPRDNTDRFKPAIRKIGSMVYMKGQININAHSANINIATVPEGFAPIYEVSIPNTTSGIWVEPNSGIIKVKADNNARNNQPLIISWLID